MSQDAGFDIDYDDPEAVDRELARIQGAGAGTEPLPDPREEITAPVVAGTVVDNKRTVEFMGRRFRIADKIGVMPLLKFSMYADVAITDMRGLAAMYAMLRDCIHPGSPGCGECESCKADDEASCAQYDPGDWRAFEDRAMETRADADDVFKVITDVTEMIAGYPTEPPSGSSAGRRGISGGSTARSSGRRAKASKR